jgi:osmotically-inducible protein OsmY
VDDGVVTLTGTVQSYRRKARAEELAASFENCRGVINELEVEPPGPIPDEDIVRYVRAALDSHADITPEAIRVTALNGKVTLSGLAASASESALAEDVTLSARGVRSVENLIIVDPVETASDAGLAAEIKKSLDVTRGLRLADIQVALASNTVTLTGQVGELWQREMAEKVVQRYGIFRIRNDITVA